MCLWNPVESIAPQGTPFPFTLSVTIVTIVVWCISNWNLVTTMPVYMNEWGTPDHSGEDEW